MIVKLKVIDVYTTTWEEKTIGLVKGHLKHYVEMYGIPTYGSIDPTLINPMAIHYTLLFGMMFGDPLGQGLGYLIGN